jgi:hypothetical protein
MKFMFFYGGCWGLAQNKERAFGAIWFARTTGIKLIWLVTKLLDVF